MFLLCYYRENIHSFDLASQLLLHQLCTNAVGVVILYSAERTVSTALRLFSPPVRLPSMGALDEGDESHLAVDVVSMLVKHENGYCVNLSPLSKNLILSLVKSTLSNAGVASADDGVMMKICDESGGNPMYASELAKSLAQRHSEQVDLARVCFRITNCHRLEEIICHRFDQLNHSSQCLLKIAAAICNFGASFTFPMLHFVMVPDDQATADEQVIDDLLNIVNSESFLHASTESGHVDVAESIEGGITSEGIASHRYTFSFGISLERATIYELLLGDQKQVIHERIANYFKMIRRKDVKRKVFLEEAQHWQLASRWSRALLCYYKATLAERNERKVEELTEVSYRVYLSMKDAYYQAAVGVSSNKEIVWDTEKMVALFNMSAEETDDTAALESNSTFTLEDVSQLFEYESELLIVSLRVILNRTRYFLKGVEHANENILVLEDALQMLLLTRNSRVYSATKVSQLKHLLADPGDEATQNQESVDQVFTVGKEFVPLCLRLLSLYIENYLHLVSGDSLNKDHEKVVFFLEKLNSLRSGLQGFHEVHSLSLSVRLSCKDGDYQQACVLTNRLLSMYDFDVHSLDLISFYGADYVPASLGMISQYLLLSIEWRKAEAFLFAAKTIVEKITDVFTISTCVYFLTNSLVFMKRFDEALGLFSHYLECIVMIREDRSMKHGFYLEWLNRLVRFAEYQSSQDTDLFRRDASVLNEFVLSKNHLMKDTLDNLCVQGRSINSVMAEVCAMRITMLWNNDANLKELQSYCRALIVYVRSSLTAECGHPYETMFDKTNVILTVLQLLQKLIVQLPNEDKVNFVKPVFIKQTTKEKLNENDNSSQLNSRRIRELKEEDREKGRALDGLSFADESDLQYPPTRAALMQIVVDIVDDDLINRVLVDCHSDPRLEPYFVFTELAISMLSKAKNEAKLSLGPGDSPPSFDAKLSVMNHLKQFISNRGEDEGEGVVVEKLNVLQCYSLLETATAMSSQ